MTDCPVCSEPLPDRPERCFRCETHLREWWEFDAALAPTGGGATAAGLTTPAKPGSRIGPLVAGLIALSVALAATAAMLLVVPEVQAPVVTDATLPRPLPADPTATAVRTPTGSPAPAPSARTIAYRAQRGDSLWRIAAALTGDGRRWRTLWPDRPSTGVRENELIVVSLPPAEAAPVQP